MSSTSLTSTPQSPIAGDLPPYPSTTRLVVALVANALGGYLWIRKDSALALPLLLLSDWVIKGFYIDPSLRRPVRVSDLIWVFGSLAVLAGMIYLGHRFPSKDWSWEPFLHMVIGIVICALNGLAIVVCFRRFRRDHAKARRSGR